MGGKLEEELRALRRRIAELDRREEDRVRAVERAAHLGRILDESLNEIYAFRPGTLRFTQTNRGVCENLGYSEAELRDLTPLDVMPEFTRRSFAKLLSPLLHSESSRVRFSAVHRRKDGSTYPVDVDLQFSTDGPTKEFVAIVLDTSERRRAEAALRKSESRARAVLDNAVEGIVTIDQRGTIESVNPAAQRIFGYEADEMLGRNVRMLAPEPHRSQHDGFIANFLATGERKVIGIGREVEGRRKDGTTFPLYLSVAEVASGRERTFTGIMRDLTQIKRSEQELRSVQQQLYEAQKIEAIGQLAEGVAHEFNNHLTVILGNTELLAQRLREDEALAETVGEIADTARQSASLTQQLLAFGRRQALQPQRVDLNELLAGLERILRGMLGDRVRLAWKRAPELGWIVSDPGQIEQVIVNLAVNARDAMPGGGTLAIETGNVRLDADFAQRHPEILPGPHVCLTVEDEGCGMDSKTRAHIFEPFFTTKESGRGIGLGLATVYGILKQSGGCITVDSAVGRGTTFRLYFPTAEPAGAAGAGRPAD
jgi:PAS domain S-box-containing protein